MSKFIYLGSLLLVLIGAGSSHGVQSTKRQRSPIPAGWQTITVGSVTMNLPSEMSEQDVAQHDVVQRIFDNGNLNISIGYTTATTDALLQLIDSKPELSESEVQINGKKAIVYTFVWPELSSPLAPPTPAPPKSNPNERQYYAVAYFERPIKDEIHNVMIWAKCKGPAEREIAKKIFQTARFN